MKQFKCPVVRGANLAIALAAVITTLSQGAFAARTVSENYALSADEDWRADGIVTVPEGVTTEHIQLTAPTFCTRQTDRHGKPVPFEWTWQGGCWEEE